MEHLGDITQLKGNEIPKVDIITGGSPCQDLSVAGKREGLAGERSGLFMEQIRLIKEMRESDRADGRTAVNIRPRFMVWENVPGAFSSNKGEDFRCVLEETAKIADSNATIPRLKEDRNGKQKWSKAGAVLGDGWSIAWRVHDAQFWGVPQRRKRISLVADFAGGAATEILFEPKSLYGNTETSREEREGTTTDAERGIGETIGVDSYNLTTTGTISKTLQAERSDNEHIPCAVTFQERAGKEGGGKGILIQNERTGALSTLNNQSVCYGISSYNSNAMKSSNSHSGIYEAETTKTLDNNGGNPACNQGGMAVVFEPCAASRVGGHVYENKAGSLRANAGDNQQAVAYRGDAITSPINASNPQPGDPCHTLTDDSRNYVVIENHPADSRVKIREDGKVQTLSSRMGTGGGNVPMVMEAQAIESHGKDSRYKLKGQINQSLTSCMEHDAANGGLVMDNIQSIGHDLRSEKFTDNEITDPLTATDYKDPIKISYNSVVRRLTPLECERLQGYPDGWTDIGEWYDSKGKKHKDADSPRYKALGNSIALPFWEWMAKRMVKHINHEATMGSLFDGIGGFPLVFSRAGATPIWASEIEEFPIAVTKLRFKE